MKEVSAPSRRFINLCGVCVVSSYRQSVKSMILNTAAAVRTESPRRAVAPAAQPNYTSLVPVPFDSSNLSSPSRLEPGTPLPDSHELFALPESARFKRLGF